MQELNRNTRILIDILRLKSKRNNVNQPTDKTLSELWWCYGISHKEFTSEQCIAVLKAWVSILYGADVVQQLDFDEMLSNNYRAEANLNIPYYQGEIGAPHFYIGDKFMSVVEEVSKVLPNYE